MSVDHTKTDTTIKGILLPSHGVLYPLVVSPTTHTILKGFRWVFVGFSGFPYSFTLLSSYSVTKVSGYSREMCEYTGKGIKVRQGVARFQMVINARMCAYDPNDERTICTNDSNDFIGVCPERLHRTINNLNNSKTMQENELQPLFNQGRIVSELIHKINENFNKVECKYYIQELTYFQRFAWSMNCARTEQSKVDAYLKLFEELGEMYASFERSCGSDKASKLVYSYFEQQEEINIMHFALKYDR